MKGESTAAGGLAMTTKEAMRVCRGFKVKDNGAGFSQKWKMKEGFLRNHILALSFQFRNAPVGYISKEEDGPE